MKTRKNRLFVLRLSIFTLLLILLAACSSPTAPATAEPSAENPASPTANAETSASSESIYIGVSGPLTGNNARYGAQWKKGFDLALDEINGTGGINGRKIEYIFEDSQSDPKQSVIIAQKFVADPKIIVELGDFSSTASMAASKIYQQGGLVQFGFTNSHPDFTKAGGDFTWSNSVTQSQAAPALADFGVNDLGLKKIAVLWLNNDWGKATYGLFEGRVKELGAEIVTQEAYLADEKDFRSALTRVRDSNPEGIALISYQADGALIAQQIRESGLEQPIFGAASLQSPDFLNLGGQAVEGAYILGEFLSSDPDPAVQAFVEKYRAKYDEEPDNFAVQAYDTIILIAEAIRIGGPTREGVHGALPQLKDVPSIKYGKVTFDLESRRVLNPRFSPLIVEGNQFVKWDGVKPASN